MTSVILSDRSEGDTITDKHPCVHVLHKTTLLYNSDERPNTVNTYFSYIFTVKTSLALTDEKKEANIPFIRLFCRFKDTYKVNITMQTGKVIDHIVKWLKDYAVQNGGVKGFTVGISNGIDSSVVSTLCARTGLPVLAVELPIHLSKKKEKSKSIHIEWLKNKYGTDHIRTMNVNLTDPYNKFQETCTELQSNDKTELALANVQSRLRMVALYYFAQVNRYLVVGTGNKVEDFGVGFFTKYGDGGVDINPIGDLLKSEVRELARELGIDRSIIDAAPTDGLFGDMRTDEAQIGATYDELEWAMKQQEQGNDEKQMNERQKKVMNIYFQRHQANHHKMKKIPVCIIPEEFKQSK